VARHGKGGKDRVVMRRVLKADLAIVLPRIWSAGV
jgi:hypothetical protein